MVSSYEKQEQKDKIYEKQKHKRINNLFNKLYQDNKDIIESEQTKNSMSEEINIHDKKINKNVKKYNIEKFFFYLIKDDSTFEEMMNDKEQYESNKKTDIKILISTVCNHAGLKKQYYDNFAFIFGEFLTDEKKPKPDIHKIALAITECYDIIVRPAGDNEKSTDKFYTYNDGIWEKMHDGFLGQDIERWLGSYCKNNDVNEVIKKVKRMVEIDEDFENQEPNHKACVKNGVLHLEDPNNIKFTPHDKKYKFQTKYNVEYDPKTDCPWIKHFLKTSMQPDDAEQFKEFGGKALKRLHEHKKAAIAVGAPGTGKTQMMQLMFKFMEGAYSNLPLSTLASSRFFDRIPLVNKRLNLCDELDTTDIRNNSTIKNFISDGKYQVEEKFGGIRFMDNTAKHIFACNQVPQPKDTSDEAYFTRWLIWKFKYQYDPKTFVHRLYLKMIQPKELSGLLNLFLEGLQQFYNRGNDTFYNEPSPETVKKMMLNSNQTIPKFVENCVYNDPDNAILKSELYEKYRKYCQNNKSLDEVESRNRFIKFFSEVVDYARSKKTEHGQCFVNINVDEEKLKAEDEEDEEMDEFDNVRYFNDESDKILQNFGEQKVISKIEEFVNKHNNKIHKEQLIMLVKSEYEISDKEASKLIQKLVDKAIMTTDKTSKYYCIENIDEYITSY